MANLVFLPGVNALVNGVFGPWAGLVNGGIALANVAPWLGELAHLTGSAPAPVKELHQALARLYEAADSNDFEAFQAAAHDVEKQIEAITKNPSKDNFKNYGRLQYWDTYLKPLKELQHELEHFRTRGMDGYSTDRLEAPLKGAVLFMNGEIKAHTGLVNKALSKVAQEAKQVARDEFGSVLGGSGPALKLQMKLSPLQQLVHDLTKFRTNPDHYLEPFKQQELLADLQKLEKYHPHFKGVHAFIIGKISEEKGSLIRDVDRHLVAFILEQIVPKIEGEAFYLAYYQAALKLNHVAQGYITESREDQITWGRKCSQGEIKNAKEKGTLFAAVSFILELNHFQELNDFAAKPHDNPKSLARKVDGIIALIENHPTIMMDRRFQETITGLIDGIIKQGYSKRGLSSLEALQAAHRLNLQGNFGGALYQLKALFEGSGESRRQSTIITQGVAALKEQARAYGVPESLLAPVDTVADMVDSRLSGVLQGPGKGEKLAPFAKLQAHLDLFRSDRGNRNERTMERALQSDLKGIEAAYPELLGLVQYVYEQRGTTPSIECVDILIAQFVKEKFDNKSSPLAVLLGHYDNQFFLSIYHAADKDTFQIRIDTEEQVSVGMAIFLSKEYSPATLMHAVEKVYEARSLELIVKDLKASESDQSEDLSRKINIALGVLAAHPSSEELSGMLEVVYAQVQGYIDGVAKFAGSADDERIDRAQALAREGKYAEALKALKEVFDSGTLLEKVGEAVDLSRQISAVAVLAENYEKSQVVEEGVMTPEKQQELIALEERKLAHNLSMFTTFKVIAKRRGLSTMEAEKMFEVIISKVEEVEYDGSSEQYGNKHLREEIFKTELEKLTHAGTIDRFVNWIVFKLVKHFTSQFSKAIVQGAQSALVNPLNRPLKGHHGIMRAANNGILALLFAERIWSEDETGQLGIDEKDSRLISILDSMNHKGKKGQDLVKEVVDKALDEFNTGQFSRFNLLNRMITFVVKKMAQLIVNKMQLADSVLETMSDTIYSDKHANYSIDILLLNQIKELEKVLGEEGAELVIREGDNGKRLAQQLVDNLFILLEQRKQTSPGSRQFDSERQSLHARLEGATDTIVKGVLRDLMLFGIEQFQKPERMNQTVLEVLKHANRALRPSTATLLRELFSEKPEETAVEDLILLFESKYRDLKTSPKGTITRQECEAALAQKYQSIERELHEAMDRIISKAVGGVVESQVESLLKTPRQAVLESVQWVHEQFSPYRAHLVGKKAYIYEMEALLSEKIRPRDVGRYENVQSQIQERHKKFLLQLQNQLKALKALRTEEPSPINHQINRLYKAINKLNGPLNDLNTALEVKDNVKALKALSKIRALMPSIEGELAGIEWSLDWQQLSLAEKGKETALSAGKQGAENIKPYVRMFLDKHIKGRADETVAMYKARSTFAAMMQQGVFRSYLEYQPSPDDEVDPDETIAADTQRLLASGWETVGGEGPSREMGSYPELPFQDGLWMMPFVPTGEEVYY